MTMVIFPYYSILFFSFPDNSGGYFVRSVEN